MDNFSVSTSALRKPKKWQCATVWILTVSMFRMQMVFFTALLASEPLLLTDMEIQGKLHSCYIVRIASKVTKLCWIMETRCGNVQQLQCKLSPFHNTNDVFLALMMSKSLSTNWFLLYLIWHTRSVLSLYTYSKLEACWRSIFELCFCTFLPPSAIWYSTSMELAVWNTKNHLRMCSCDFPSQPAVVPIFCYSKGAYH